MAGASLRLMARIKRRKSHGEPVWSVNVADHVRLLGQSTPCSIIGSRGSKGLVQRSMSEVGEGCPERELRTIRMEDSGQTEA
jgi:hypothetical protein